MLAELRRAVGEWVSAFAGRARFTSGWGARKFADWLAEGREVPVGAAAPRAVALAPPPAPSEPEREYTPSELAAIDAQLEATVKRLKNAHLTPTPTPRSPSTTCSGDMYEQSPAEREAERQRQLAALAAITGPAPSRVA